MHGTSGSVRLRGRALGLRREARMAWWLAAVLVAATGSAVATAPALARPVLHEVAGTTLASVVVGEGVIYSSDALQRSWDLVEGINADLEYTCVVATTGDLFIAGALDGSIWASSNSSGDAFVQRAVAAAAAIRGITQSQGQLLAVGEGGTVRRSFDLTGGSWVAVDSPTTESLWDVAANATTMVAVGENGTVLRGGALATDLTEVDLGVSTHFYAVVSDPTTNGRFLAVGERGEMWESLGNGTSWSRVDAGISETIYGASQIGPATVVVGDGGAIYYSPGGFDNWGPASSAGSDRLLDVTYTGSTAIACGFRRTVLWSEIGLTWTRGGVTPTQQVTWGRVKSRFSP